MLPAVQFLSTRGQALISVVTSNNRSRTNRRLNDTECRFSSVLSEFLCRSFFNFLSKPLLYFGTLEFPCFTGTYLPKQECLFVHNVLEELDAFLQRDDHKSRLRFLIHKTAENFPDLSTFSVGKEWSRRVAVCYSALRLSVVECSSDDKQPFISSRRMEGKSQEGKSALSKRTRRPDKAIYVPRALRQSECETSLSSSSCSLSVKSNSDNTDPPPANHESVNFITDESVDDQDATMYITRAKLVDCRQTLPYFIPMTLEKETSSSDTSEINMSCRSSEDMDDYHHEIVACLKEEPSVIEHTLNDYSSFEDIWIDYDEFAHVIEIYDFPTVFKSSDLMDAFAEYGEGGMKIKWVDNTHALGVFSTASAALQALSIRHPLLKTRTLDTASMKARGKVVKCSEFLQLVKDRPRTDTSVARRMVTGALGLRSKRY